ncbi:MAG: lmo0937 family membrane protein [Myxococcales bacterium]|nr:lmo0937 family membrane protein [Myxococcales bacterium]
MLWMLSAMLLVLWLAGMVAAAGPWIHVVLVAAMVAVAYSLLRHDRLDTI